MRTLAESLSSAARLLGSRPYLVTPQQTLTFSAFDRSAARLANVLREAGVAPGDVVGLFLPSKPFIAIGYYACQKLGAVAAPMSSMNRQREIEMVISRTSMKVMLVDHSTLPFALEARTRLGNPQTLLTTDGPTDDALDADALMRAAEDAFDPFPGLAGDPAALFFTSGTTGAPKGAIQTQGSLYATLRDMTVYNRFRWGTEVFMNALPLFNNFGATCMMNAAVFSGATMIMLERWDTELVLRSITEHKATFIAGSPTMFLYLLRDFNPQQHDLSSIRLGATGGAPVSPTIVEQFQQKLGAPLVQVYGATEVSGYVTGAPVLGIQKRGSAGLPIGATAIQIVDDDGSLLPANAVGEVRVSGDVVGGGYWDDAQTTAATFTDEGWLSGDLGYLDEDGYLFIVDRKKDVIISGGFNIYPLEVEDVLYSFDAVRVCAVIGLPDQDKGEIPAAVLVPKEGCEIKTGEIIAYCKKHVSAYKVPRRVFTVSDMPLGPSGKILKRELRDRFASGKLQELV
ncbi:MAG: AMP-binding protein [Burkholderiaceae bacterium]